MSFGRAWLGRTGLFVTRIFLLRITGLTGWTLRNCSFQTEERRDCHNVSVTTFVERKPQTALRFSRFDFKAVHPAGWVHCRSVGCSGRQDCDSQSIQYALPGRWRLQRSTRRTHIRWTGKSVLFFKKGFLKFVCVCHFLWSPVWDSCLSSTDRDWQRGSSTRRVWKCQRCRQSTEKSVEKWILLAPLHVRGKAWVRRRNTKNSRSGPLSDWKSRGQKQTLWKKQDVWCLGVELQAFLNNHGSKTLIYWECFWNGRTRENKGWCVGQLAYILRV